MIGASGVSFSYREGEPILVSSSITLSPGRCHGLLGANGSGKSTFLGVLTDSIRGTTTGTVSLGPTVGFATQEIALYRHLTVKENLTHAARLFGHAWNVVDLVATAIDDYSLAPIADTAARKLSGGQQRIAHLACSFVSQPNVRLLDEPTTALDFETRELLVALIRRWRDEGIAALLTGHYPEDIEELCTDITALIDGRTHFLGPLDQLLGSTWLQAAPASWDSSLSIRLERGRTVALQDIRQALASYGVAAGLPLDTLSLSPLTLRDLLRADPTLRSSLEE